MEELDPFDMDDPEILELSKEAKDVQYPVQGLFVVSGVPESRQEMDDWYASSVDGPAPRIDDWTPAEKPKMTRKRTHFLLNTMTTVSVSGNCSYGYGPCDYDFTYDLDRNRGNLVAKPRPDGREPKAPEFARFAHIFYDCIIPNAIIAMDAGYLVTADDACRAIYQGMRTKATEDAIARWEGYVKERGGNAWVQSTVKEAFNLYVLGIKRDGQQKKRYTLESYIKNHMMKHCKGILKKLKKFKRYKSPALDKLIGMCEKNPGISTWTFQRIHDELGFSKNTVARFREYMKGRGKGIVM